MKIRKQKQVETRRTTLWITGNELHGIINNIINRLKLSPPDFNFNLPAI
jgi:hypothetical protein